MKVTKFILPVYILLLGVGAGLTIAFGAFCAPVIFNASDFVGFEVSRFDSGLLMTEIFIRGNNLLNVLGIIILAYEVYNYRYTTNRDKIPFILGGFSVISIFMFSMYYTPQILAFQKLGAQATESEAFEVIHKSSEIDFGILLLSLSALAVYRTYKLINPE